MNSGEELDQMSEGESDDQEENDRDGGAGNTVRGRRSDCHSAPAFPSGVRWKKLKSQAVS